jgi:hypothetical protein
MPSKTGMSDDERAEYGELGSAYRNDDAIGLAVGALLLPLAFGSLAVTWQSPQLFFPMLLVSAFAIAVYAMYSARLSMYTAVRLRRLRDLESKANLRHHRAIAEAVRTRQINAPRVGALQYTTCILWAIVWPITAILVDTHQLPLK